MFIDTPITSSGQSVATITSLNWYEGTLTKYDYGCWELTLSNQWSETEEAINAEGVHGLNVEEPIHLGTTDFEDACNLAEAIAEDHERTGAPKVEIGQWLWHGEASEHANVHVNDEIVGLASIHPMGADENGTDLFQVEFLCSATSTIEVLSVTHITASVDAWIEEQARLSYYYSLIL